MKGRLKVAKYHTPERQDCSLLREWPGSRKLPRPPPARLPEATAEAPDDRAPAWGRGAARQLLGSTESH